MNRLKGIKNIADVKEVILLHKESIKKAALPIVVVAALLFFWIGGEKDTNEIKEIENPDSDVVQEEIEESEINETSKENTEIYVDISGCVYKPGVYKINDGTRLFQVIEKAGGLTEDADRDSINQAEKVYDGQKILIQSKLGINNVISDYTKEQNGKININTADSMKLQEIPGVGPSTAKKIIDYRETYGKFKSVEDIVNVSGIGEKTFENIREYIIV